MGASACEVVGASADDEWATEESERTKRPPSWRQTARGGGGDGLGRRGGDSFGAGGGEQLRVATGDDGRLIGAVGAGVLISAEGVVGVFFRVGSAAAMQAKHAAGGRRRRSRWRWRWRR